MQPTALCRCGRKIADATTTSYRSSSRRFTFHRCQCGLEWTDSELDVDVRDPVSAEEVIAVHERMSRKDELPLDELTR